MLENTKPENEFVLLGGGRIKNIVELGRELKQMSDDVFMHHVTQDKNDFANWIENCVKDERLGILARTTKDKHRMAAIVERRIKELTNPSPPQTKRPAQHTISQPTIIRTRNVTMLHLSHKPAAPEREIIRTPHKTHLRLTHAPRTEIYVHEVNKHHHRAALLISHIVLGIVVGVAVAALVVAFNT
jgi:hypothetical protein